MISPLRILDNPYSVILLNQNGEIGNVSQFTRIWNQAQVRVSVDGGTNSWYSLHKNDAQLQLPHVVCGDFDSIQPEILSYVQGIEAIKVIPTPDQDETDFTKAFQILCDSNGPLPSPTSNTVLAIATNKTGRFDQQISNLNTLIKSLATTKDLYLYDFSNVIFSLRPNEPKEILLRPNLTCGIIPIDGPTNMTSQGLKWDLGGCYRFGDIVSTSNETIQDVVKLQVNRYTLFTASVSLLP